MKIKSWIVVSDYHCPFHNINSHHSFLKFLKDFKPDGLVLNGDFIDMYSVSRHLRGIADLEDENSKQIIKLKSEFDSSNKVLDDFEKSFPKNVINILSLEIIVTD